MKTEIKQHLPYKFDVNTSGFRLPEDFLFGVCNSPYHSEGFFNMEGYPFNQWGKWELDGYIEKSGTANDFWNNWQAHIDKAKEIGLNAFRLGLSWTRVQPSFSPEEGAEPPIDYSALDRYAQIISDVYKAGMQPVITIYHFVQPAWVGVDLWHEDALVDKFIGFSKLAVGEINARLVKMGHHAIGFWVIFNEPDVIAGNVYLNGEYPHNPDKMGEKFAAIALDNIMYSYIKLYDYIHDLYDKEGWSKPLCGFNLPSNCYYEHDKGQVDLCLARRLKIKKENLEYYFDKNRLDFYNNFAQIADRRFGTDTDKRSYFEESKNSSMKNFNLLGFKKAIEALYASDRDEKLDYIAVDIYDLMLPAQEYDKGPEFERTPYEPAHRPGWWDWCLEKNAVEDYLELYGRCNLGLPMYMIENSVGHLQEKYKSPIPRRDGLTRPQYLRETLSEAIRAIQKGYPIKGYLYWSLCDNYEWGSFAVRLGLLEYDYENMVIKDTDGFGYPTAKIYADLIKAMRSNDKNQIQEAFGT